MIRYYQMETFATWLQQQLDERHLDPSEFARMARMPLPVLWRILNEQRGVGILSARRIARGLGLPEEVVLAKAGLVSARSWQVTPDELVFLSEYRQLTEAEQSTARAIIRTLRESRSQYRANNQ